MFRPSMELVLSDGVTGLKEKETKRSVEMDVWGVLELVSVLYNIIVFYQKIIVFQLP